MGDPLATQPPTTMIMHRLRMAIIDKFGVHLQSIGLLEIIQPEPEYLTSRCIYFPNDDARAKLMVVEGEFIPDYPMDDAPQLMVSSFPIDMDDPDFEDARNCNDICEEWDECDCIDPVQVDDDQLIYR